MIQRISTILDFNPDERFDYVMIMKYIDEVDGSEKTQWIKLEPKKSYDKEKNKEENDIYLEFMRDADYSKGLQK